MSRRFLLSLAASVGVLVLCAVPASAHVKIDPSSATQGSYAMVTFRVPNEESDADTVGLRVQLPVGHPFRSVSVQPKPGWTYQTKTKKLDKPITGESGSIDQAVSEVDWSGGRIKPGEFDTFSVSVGPLPTNVDQLVFKTIQEYETADGTRTEVAWIQVPGPGGAEPEHPAPVLQLVPASGSDHHGEATATTAPTVTATAGSGTGTGKAAVEPASKSTVETTLAIAVAGLVLAVIALILALTRKSGARGGGVDAD